MRKLLLLATLLAVLASFVIAAPVLVGINEDVHFDYQGMKANDFHIEGTIISGFGVVPKVKDIIVFGDPGTGNWCVMGYSLTRNAYMSPDWTFKCDFKTDQMIVQCQWIHFGIIFEVEGNNIVFDLVGWWTWNSGPPVPMVVLGGATLQAEPGGEFLQAAVTGFQVEGDMLRVFNHSDVPIELRDYEVAISNESIPLEDMFATGLGRPGDPSPQFPWLVWEDAVLQPIILQPGQPFEIPLSSIGIFLQPGQFLVMRGDAPAVGTKFPLLQGRDDVKTVRVTQDWGWIWHQHGE